MERMRQEGVEAGHADTCGHAKRLCFFFPKDNH